MYSGDVRKKKNEKMEKKCFHHDNPMESYVNVYKNSENEMNGIRIEYLNSDIDA